MTDFLEYLVHRRLFLLQSVQLQIFVVDQEKLPERHAEHFLLGKIQNLTSNIQQAGDIYPVCPLITFGEANSSGSGSDMP